MPGPHVGKEKSGREEDALAPAGDEGRGQPRKCPGTSQRGLIRACPNGATRRAFARHHRMSVGPTRGTETSQYPEERKEMIDSPSSGERTGISLNRACFRAVRGCRTAFCGLVAGTGGRLENGGAEGDTPVRATVHEIQAAPE